MIPESPIRPNSTKEKTDQAKARGCDECAPYTYDTSSVTMYKGKETKREISVHVGAVARVPLK